jgi:hypothetical protein
MVGQHGTERESEKLVRPARSSGRKTENPDLKKPDLKDPPRNVQRTELPSDSSMTHVLVRKPNFPATHS